MRYDERLAQGWPIASGPVEGACKSPIRDRMERSGMRRTQKLGEAVVQLGAIHLSGDLDSYWAFHLEKTGSAFIPATGAPYYNSHTRLSWSLCRRPVSALRTPASPVTNGPHQADPFSGLPG
jgi:hypothetical protein